MAGYIQYKNQHGIEYGSYRVSYWDANEKRHKKKIEHLGRVLDKERLIFKDREHGVYQFDIETKSFNKVPDGIELPKIERKPRAKKEKVVKESCEVLTYGHELAVEEIIKKRLKDALEGLNEVNVDALCAMLCYYTLGSKNCDDLDSWYTFSFVKHLYPDLKLSSQRKSEILAELGTEENRRLFFRNYFKHIKDKTGNKVTRVAIDSTGLTNFSKLFQTAISNHGGKFNNEMRMLYVVEESLGYPIYFKLFPGNVIDSKTLARTLDELKEFGLEPEYVVVDAGYMSKEDVSLFEEHKIQFLSRMPAIRKTYHTLVEQCLDITHDPNNAVKYNDRLVYMKAMPCVIDGLNDEQIEGYAYVCRDLTTYADEVDRAHRSFLAGDLTAEGVSKVTKTGGFFVLFTNNKQEASSESILAAYYARQHAEQTFDVAKNMSNLLPLKVHKQDTLLGHLLLSFMSVVVLKEIQAAVKGTNISARKALSDLRNLRIKTYEGYARTEEPQRGANLVFKYLNITCPVRVPIGPE